MALPADVQAVIGDWLAGETTEDEAIARYRRLRDASVVRSFEECTSVGRDLAQLAVEA